MSHIINSSSLSKFLSALLDICLEQGNSDIWNKNLHLFLNTNIGNFLKIFMKEEIKIFLTLSLNAENFEYHSTINIFNILYLKTIVGKLIIMVIWEWLKIMQFYVFIFKDH